MLLAARAITHLLEALPNSTSNVVSAGVIPPLISKLETIEFIDVAEISLQVEITILFMMFFSFQICCEPIEAFHEFN